jgi:hypothetical protein
MTAGHFVTPTGALAADTLRGRRVRLSAELRPHAAGTAALWLRVDGAPIAPDEIVPYTDDAVQRARAWRTKASGCRGGS